MEDGPEHFLTSYTAYLRSQGQTIDGLKLPSYCEKPADLYRPFSYAQQHGGFYGVDQAKKWRECATHCGAKLTTSSSSHMKTTYDRLLRPFEDWIAEQAAGQGSLGAAPSSDALPYAWMSGVAMHLVAAPAGGVRAPSNGGRSKKGSNRGGGGNGAAAAAPSRASPTPSPSAGGPGSTGARSGQSTPAALMAVQLQNGGSRKRKQGGEDEQQQQQQQQGLNGSLDGQMLHQAPVAPPVPPPAQPQQEGGAPAVPAGAAPSAEQQAATQQAEAGEEPGVAASAELAEGLYRSILPSAGPILQVPAGLLEDQGARVVGALRCGLPGQESWALNALALLSFQTTLLLPSLPGLADALMQLIVRGFPPGETFSSQPPTSAAATAAAAGRQSPRGGWADSEPPAALQLAATAAAAVAHPEALLRLQHVFPNHPQLEYRAQAAAAAAQVLYNAAAAAAAEPNAAALLTPRSLQCWIHVLRAAHDMYDHAPGGHGAVAVRWQCQQPFLQEAAISVLQLLERLAPQIALEPPAAAAGGGPLAQLLAAVVGLVAPGRPLLPLQLCTAALDTLTAWAASGAGNAMAVQQCCTADSPQLLRNVVELLACPFDDIRAQGEERAVEEGGFPESGEGGEGEDANGVREVCIDMATVIMQVRLLASATQLLLRVVSSRAVEVRRSVAVHTRLIKLLAGVAAHDHPGYPLSWQVNPTRAAHLTAIKDRMLPLFEHRSIVLKQARMHATTILASLAFDPATRQYVLPYEAQILQQVMCGRVPADGPMNALLAALQQTG